MLTPYLVFDGRCAEAMRCYADALDGTLTILQRYGDSPAAGQAADDRILHARLELDGSVLLASDAPAGLAAPFGGFSIAVQATTIADAERRFAALSDGGVIVMPLQATFWARRFGMLTDRFGVGWMVSLDTAAGDQG